MTEMRDNPNITAEELRKILGISSIQELNFFLSQDKADFYIFPEGFLDSNVLQEAIDIIKEKEKYVITGFKDLNSNGQQKALVIDNGKIVDEYTKCVLLKQNEYGGFIAER